MTATPPQGFPSRKTMVPLAAAALLGLGLRIAAARGDYWLDEAWSALFARDAGTPGRVLFAINHDNNHFLNTLWLQLVGWGAAPMLGRALSIASGTAAVIVAGLIGRRRGWRPAIAAALLFATAPILVTYGSEARGYAPMLLALLTAIWIVDRELNGPPLRNAPIWLGLAALLGMLAHISMLVGIVALTLWVASQTMRKAGGRAAALATWRLMGRAVLAAGAVLALIAIGAAASPHGFRMGVRTSFAWAAFIDALDYMVAYTLGWPFEIGFWLLPVLLVPAVLGVRGRALFHFIAIFGLPLAVAVIEPANAAFPRYYLLSAVALLLMLADLLTARRWTLVLLAAMIVGSLVVDLRVIGQRRGDPGAAVDAIMARAPAGAVAMPDEAKDSAVLEAAAARRSYRLRIADGCNADTRFLFAENNGTTPFAPTVARCGARFRSIAAGQSYGLSGMDWQLYERMHE
jgi:hypothetical protein